MKRKDFFWTSYADLMTSLFFIMLVLFSLSYFLFQKNLGDYKVKAREAELIQSINRNLDTLMSDTDFFIYEVEYKRYRLAQDIHFKSGRSNISPQDIIDYESVSGQLLRTGIKLNNIIVNLRTMQQNDDFRHVTYVLVIAGRASKDQYAGNYELSYNRALSLYRFWKDKLGIDFDSPGFHDIIDVQISGNGIGGIGRFPSYKEEKNQTFLIQIIPKIHRISTQ